MATLSKTQIDRLGDRLRDASPREEDIRSLDEYRQSFTDAYVFVITSIHQNLEHAPTGRPSKTLPSIIQKLRRESIRLSQIQDIAGCRIVAADVSKQDAVVESLRSLFPNTNIMDRRLIPSHGYRAVHLITRISEKLVEIQVRTELQHLWAELSEWCSDVYNPGLKYGIGDPESLRLLAETSEAVVQMETMETEVQLLESDIAGMHTTNSANPGLPSKVITLKLQLIDVMDTVTDAKKMLRNVFEDLLSELEKKKGQKQ